VQIDKRQALGQLDGDAVARPDAAHTQHGHRAQHDLLQFAVAHALGAGEVLIDKFNGDFVWLLQAKMLERIKKHNESLSLVGAMAAPAVCRAVVDGVAPRRTPLRRGGLA
jgi:hypothetical protein